MGPERGAHEGPVRGRVLARVLQERLPVYGSLTRDLTRAPSYCEVTVSQHHPLTLLTMPELRGVLEIGAPGKIACAELNDYRHIYFVV